MRILLLCRITKNIRSPMKPLVSPDYDLWLQWLYAIELE